MDCIRALHYCQKSFHWLLHQELSRLLQPSLLRNTSWGQERFYLMGFSFSLSLLIPNQLITSVLNAFFINILLIFITTARKYTCLEDKNLHKISFHQIKCIFLFLNLCFPPVQFRFVLIILTPATRLHDCSRCNHLRRRHNDAIKLKFTVQEATGAHDLIQTGESLRPPEFCCPLKNCTDRFIVFSFSGLACRRSALRPSNQLTQK